MTLRVRVLEPAPHDLVHSVHTLHAEVPQWIGQAPWAQATVWVRASQVTPPCAVAVAIVRRRVFMPVLHDLVHAV